MPAQSASLRTHKYRGNSDQQDMSWETTGTYGVGNGSGSYGQRVLGFETLETIGAKTPGYYELVASGKLLPHTSFLQHYAVGSASGSQNRLETFSTGKWRRSVINNFVASNPNHSTSPFQGMPSVVLPYYYISMNEALAQADQDNLPGLIQEAQSKAYSSGHDTLTFLAELHKVRDMFVKRANRLLSLPAPKRWDKTKPGDWLEWRYGWRTALFDIQSLSDALVNVYANRKRISQRSGLTQNFTTHTYLGETAAEIDTYIHHISTEVEVSYRGSVTADFSAPRFAINPVTTAWELLPYSFIIDWFISVGSWLNSLSFLALSEQSYTSGGYQIQMKQHLERRVLTWQPIGTTQFSGTRELYTDCETVTKVRIPMSASFRPTLRLKLDGLKVIDLLSIIYQRLR